MEIKLLAFSDKGYELAGKIVQRFGGSADLCRGDIKHAAWTKEHFNADAIIYVGACGIATRSIAPFVKSKTTDPAVLVIDDGGNFVIPILSGHLGGANDLARRVAEFLNATPVITTATDINGVWAVDEWARHQGMAVVTPKKIVNVSSKILKGEKILVESDWKIAGDAPKNVEQVAAEKFTNGENEVTDVNKNIDVKVTINASDTDACIIAPRILTLGVGCRKGTTMEAIEEAFGNILKEGNLLPESFAGIATIDLKKGEPGLLEFAKTHNLTITDFTAEQLSKVEGDFSASEFVAKTVGVDNVCERSAALLSGGNILIKKRAGSGVTMAVSIKEFSPNWN